MPDKDSDPKDPAHQREMALSRWDTDGGNGPKAACSEACIQKPSRPRFLS